MKRLYSSDQHEIVRARRAVDEWHRSEVISHDDRDGLLRTLPIDLRLNRLILRIVLFGATTLLVAALHFWIDEFVGSLVGSMDTPLPLALLAVMYAVAAEVAVSRFRVYRYGTEEALALAAAVYAGFAVGSTVGPSGLAETLAGWLRDPPSTFALFAAGIVALGMFERFESVPLAVAGEVLVAAAIVLGSPSRSVLVLSLVFGLVFAGYRVRALRFPHGYREDAFRLLGSVALCLTYLGFSLEAFRRDPSTLYVMLVAMIGVGAGGVYGGIRSRDRILMNVGAGLTLLTIVTAKAYLGWPYEPWGGIELGAALIVTAVLLRRWIASGPEGERWGFTARRILSKDELVFAAATFAAPAVASNMTVSSASPEPQRPGLDGGRSGGAGATGDY